jgi:hypothetical protein
VQPGEGSLDLQAFGSPAMMLFLSTPLESVPEPQQLFFSRDFVRTCAMVCLHQSDLDSGDLKGPHHMPAEPQSPRLPAIHAHGG